MEDCAAAYARPKEPARPPVRRPGQAADPLLRCVMQCSSRTARLPRPYRDVTDRDAHLADHLSRDLTGTRADRPRSDKTVPLDHNEAFGPMQPANLVIIADHFTERAGGRPHTDMRLANLFDPCLVKPRLTGTVGRDVENPVTDLGSDPTPVSHSCSKSRIWVSCLTRRTPVSSATISSALPARYRFARDRRAVALSAGGCARI